MKRELANLTRRSVLVSLRATALAPVAASLASCSKQYPSFRYRLTMTFSQSGVIHTGFSVVEVRPRIEQTIDEGLYTENLVGESTYVDLGNGSALLAILRGRDRLTGRLLGMYEIHGGVTSDNLKALSMQRGARQLTLQQLPLLLFFPNDRNPKNYIILNYSSPGQWAPGLEFVGATIEITDQSVTHDLRDHLTWVRSNGGYLNPTGLHGQYNDISYKEITKGG